VDVGPTIVVDGVAYFPGRIRQIIRERHQLASEVRLLRQTLVLRTAALNRVSETNEMLRAMGRPNP